MSTLDVTFVTPSSTVWRGEATQVVVPAADGSLGILPRMQPTLAILKPGKVRVFSTSGKIDEFDVDGGFVAMDHDKVTIGVRDTESLTAAVNARAEA